MKTYSPELMQKLSVFNTIIDLKPYSKQLDMLTNNNIRQKALKPPGVDNRTPDMIRAHSAQGLAAEIAIAELGYESYTPIVEDAYTLDKNDRQVDFCLDDIKTQIKTYNPSYGTIYVSESQKTSIQKASWHNELFLLSGCKKVDDMMYHVTMNFLVDSSKIMMYIVDNPYGKSRYRFHYEAAIRRGDCIDLKELAYA